MVKIAQVIVDVPLMQTDKPFSYIIPKNVEDQVTIGSRVHVPFGRGNRLLQGFVVGFSDTFDNTVNDLKAISEVLDFEPVLNAEQLELAEQMRHTVFSYKISILKSMIPNLLNSQYDKRLTPTESLSSEEHLALFGEKESRLHSSLTEEEVKKVARLVQAGKITVDYLAKDKKNIKTEKYYHVQAEKIVAADISNRAKKRLELRDYLLEHPEEGKLSDLHHLFSRDVVKFFVDNQLIFLI